MRDGRREALKQLRALVYGGDGPGLVAALGREPWPPHSLQLIGDGLRAAVRDDVGGSAEAARTCVDALGERSWTGDRDLVEALHRALGTGPTPMLRPVPIDLEDLAEILEGDPVHGGGRVDLVSGEVWPQSALEYAEEMGEDVDDDDPDRWLWVDCEGSRSAYRDMVRFIDDVDDRRFADRLSRAIDGRWAFRRFQGALDDRPELLTLWHAFSGDRQRGRARNWLAAEGYTPLLRGPRRTAGDDH